MKLILINILFIILAIGIGSLLFLIPFFKSKQKIKNFIYNNKLLFITAIVLIIGFLTRISFIDIFPGGLNQDEASAGYDAFAIMKYGIDRNGKFLPIHLVSWGSGQNALYSYLCIPFIFIFGLNPLSIRLPMALIGCISIFLTYRFFKKEFNDKIGLIALIFIIINPWHFMKCRWALESNLFPDLVFISFFLLVKGLKENKKVFFFISSVLLGISSYSYGTSYFFLFFFVIGFVVYLLLIKKLKIINGLIYVGIIGIICLPIIIFIYINTFGGEEISFLGFTIPKLTENRFQTVTNIFSGTFFKTGFEQLFQGLNLIINQNDGGHHWNYIEGIGTTYLISTPFTIIGLFYNKKEQSTWINILRIWLITSLLMLFIVSPNINRINIIYFPLIIFTFIGIYQVIELSRQIKHIIYTSYMVYFLVFSSMYVTTYNNKIKEYFFYSYIDAISFASRIEDVDNYYITSNVNAPYIHALFASEYDVNEYIETKNIINPGAAFEYASSFGNYYFYLPQVLKANNVYIVDKGNSIYANEDLSSYQVTEFERYIVIDTTN